MAPVTNADRNPLECGVVEDCAGEADAMHVGQDAVDEDHRGGELAKDGHGLLTAAHTERLMAAALQGVGQESADGVIVLDDENGRNASFDHRAGS